MVNEREKQRGREEEQEEAKGETDVRCVWEEKWMWGGDDGMRDCRMHIPSDLLDGRI
jgi:hypothetical protein